jgi:tetratricopeptide (TPR) repeat protein
MRTSSLCTLGLLLGLLATARADEPASAPARPTKAAKADAKKLADEATKLFNVQQYDKAAELYQQAYVLDPKPGYLYATAQAQRLSGKCETALLTYDAYLRTNPADGERAKTEANIERCKQDLAARAAAVQAQEVTPAPEVPAPPPPPAPAPVVPAAPPPRDTSYIAGHLLVGAGVIALGGGVYLFQSGRSTISSHNDASTYQQFLDGRDEMDAAKQKQTLGVVAMTAGAALVAGGVVYYVLHARNAEEPAVSATVSAQQATLWFRRSF